MTIYAPNGSVLLDLVPDDSSYHSRTIMGDDIVVLYFALPQHTELPIGSYITLDGTTYTLRQPENVNMVHTRNYEYTITFHAPQFNLMTWLVSNPIDHRMSFDFTARPREHLQLVIDNLNQRDQGWTIGECIDDTEKLVSYNYHYAWDALRDIATAFNTEYEIVGKAIYLHKVEYAKDDPLRMDYGKGNGFKSGIGRANDGGTPPPDILYVQGGSQNINYYRYGTTQQGSAILGGAIIPADMIHSYNLLLPRQKTYAFDGSFFDDESGFNEEKARHYITDKYGRFVKRTDSGRNTTNEEAYDCSNHYPKRVCEITSVTFETQPDGIRQYNISDATIPESLDYSQYVIEGDIMRVVFQSGELAGREFDVAANGYLHHSDNQYGGRTFLIVSKEEDGIMMPSENGFEPKAGDKFIVYGVMLPSSYIADNSTRTGAEWDMLRASIRYLHSIEEYLYTFKGDVDDIWAHRNWRTLEPLIRLGQYVMFKNDSIASSGLLLRISAIKQYINRKERIELTISNAPIKTDFSDERRRISTFEQMQEHNSLRRYRDTSSKIKLVEGAARNVSLSPANPIYDRRKAVFYDSLMSMNIILPPFSFSDHTISWAECFADVKTQPYIVTGGADIHMANIKHVRSDAFVNADNNTQYYVYLRHGLVNGEADFYITTTPKSYIEQADGINIYYVYIGNLSAAASDFSRTFGKGYSWDDARQSFQVSNILIPVNGSGKTLTESLSEQETSIAASVRKINEVAERSNDLTNLVATRLSTAIAAFNEYQKAQGMPTIEFSTCIAPSIEGRAIDGQCKPFPNIEPL